MAKNNSSNLDITNNADGFDVTGGTTPRKLTVSGGDVAIAGSGSAVITFPSTTGTLAKTTDIPSKAAGTDIDTGTDDAKFLTSKAVNDSHNIPDVAPGTSGNYMTSNGTDWVSTAAPTIPTAASAAEVDTGTDTAKFITPDGFAGSSRSRRLVTIKVFDDTTALTTGDGKAIFMIPTELNGMNLVAVAAAVTTVSSSGAPTVTIYNLTDSADMLSTAITIDASEFTSYTAATPPVIDTTKDDVATGDLIEINVDGAGTGAKGLFVVLSFQTP